MICANKECLNNKNFTPKTHNYEKKSIRQGAKRPCKECGTQLSRYNSENVCSVCKKSINESTKNKLLGMINDIS